VRSGDVLFLTAGDAEFVSVALEMLRAGYGGAENRRGRGYLIGI